MAHVRQQLRERAATTLTGLSTTQSKVYQSRIYPLGSANLPGLLVYTKSEDSEVVTMSGVRTVFRNLSLVIEGYVKAVSNYDDTVDTIAEEVETALGNDVTLNGLAKNSYLISTNIEYQGEGEKPVAVVSMTYNIEYMTIENAPGTSV
tara:strand:- start:8165 stop:8608 length:444 start_codon:yes stop_codon:yes gene_type:complete